MGFPGRPLDKNPPAEQGVQVWPLVREDPPCGKASKPESTGTEAVRPGARAPEQERPSR